MLKDKTMKQKILKKSLETIVEICEDGITGYETAAETINDDDLKTQFLRIVQQRKGFVEELKNEAYRLGIELDDMGTAKGFFHRTWLTAKATISTDTNEKVIEESMKGEKYAVDTYHEVMKGEKLPIYLEETLEKQQSLIKAAILQLEGLKIEAIKES
tara:strand:- start:24018 stop:24491 length:474 start_codon:yes stop_codon:yes gene_type:complete